MPLALAQGNEKARSDWIINPVLTAIRRRLQGQVSRFSGREFAVDPARNLTGCVDFLIARSPRLLVREQTIMMGVEAQPENLNTRLGQCAAEMIAAQIFNRSSAQAILGCLTHGELWKILQLKDTDVTSNLAADRWEPIEHLLGILLYLAGET